MPTEHNDPKAQEWIDDAKILLQGRWGGNALMEKKDNVPLLLFTTVGFAPSYDTCTKALGGLTDKVTVLRGALDCDVDTLFRFHLTKQKWKVPDHLEKSPGSIIPNSQTYSQSKYPKLDGPWKK